MENWKIWKNKSNMFADIKIKQKKNPVIIDDK